MCGICGIVDFAGHAADFERRLPGMSKAGLDSAGDGMDPR
jgi:hypothetical protein